MTELIYFCNKTNNKCPKKDTCRRYLKADGNITATLYKASCTKDNRYVLYIEDKNEKKEQKEEKKGGENDV